MKCRYCYGHGGTFGGSTAMMSEETAFAILDWYTGREVAKKKKEIYISFMGGEPLLNFALIKKIILYLTENFADWKKKYDMTTNGYFLTDEVIAFLIEHEVGILISFDGPPAIQNANRPLASGEDSYAAIAPKLKKLLALRPDTCASNWKVRSPARKSGM